MRYQGSTVRKKDNQMSKKVIHGEPIKYDFKNMEKCGDVCELEKTMAGIFWENWLEY